MAAPISEISINLCDNLNPGFGYSIRITDVQGRVLLRSCIDPTTGDDLLTLEDAIQVARAYER